MKICKDCKYFNTDRYPLSHHAECTREVRVDRVTGEKSYYLCETQRMYPRIACGPNGDWFKPIKAEVDITPEQESKGFLERVVKWFKK